jgi:hypothetical protein
LEKFLSVRFAFYGRILKPEARGSSRPDNNYNFLTSFGVKKTNYLAVTSNKLINNLAGLFTRGLGPAVACGPPVGSRWCTARSKAQR